MRFPVTDSARCLRQGSSVELLRTSGLCIRGSQLGLVAGVIATVLAKGFLTTCRGWVEMPMVKQVFYVCAPFAPQRTKSS